jgi:PAS domain-containing protein
MAAMAAGVATEFDLEWDKGGQLVWWYVRVIPEFDANGKVESALTIWSDISERKRIEIALRKESEKNLAFLHNASDGIHIRRLSTDLSRDLKLLALILPAESVLD